MLSIVWWRGIVGTILIIFRHCIESPFFAVLVPVEIDRLRLTEDNSVEGYKYAEVSFGRYF